MANAKVTTLRSGGGRALLPTVLVLLALVYGYATFARLWTDKLWFDSIGYEKVFTTQLWTASGLFLVFGGVMALLIGGSIWLALRKMPTVGMNPATLRYRELLHRRRKLSVAVPAVLFGAMTGLAATSMVSTYLAWRERTPFGVTDPRFGLDMSFFVFGYPWYRYVISFLLTGLVMALVVSAASHFTMGTLAAPLPNGKRVTQRSAHLQLSLISAALMVAFGVDQILNRYGLVFSQGSLLDGMTYTDDHARMGAYLVMAAVSFITAALFVYNGFRPRWRVPLTALVLMIVTSLIVGFIYPGIVQSFDVEPDKPDKERPYIEQHIAATRAAYGVDNVEIYDYSASTTAAAGQLRADAEALPGIRLIDPALVQTTFEQLQQVRGYYSFSSPLDVDRYTINQAETDVVIAAREMDQGGLQNTEWNNIHTVYTHGYGLVAAYGNKRQSGGEPMWLAQDIPTVGVLKADEPRIYYGEMQNDYVVVGRADGESPIEFDTPGGGTGGEQFNTYTGTGGVPIGSLWNRALYATRFGQIKLLLSDRVNENSRILYDRTPRELVEKAAPWLTVDNDAYPAIVDGRIVWLLDGYTTSNYYPNSHKVSMRDATSDAITTNTSVLPDEDINYIRNSVKAVVDAYDGSVKLYAWDESDPILQTWMKVYPGTVQPTSAISAELLAHMRYPEDLYKVQRQVLARYHVTNSDSWYSQSDLWTIPADPVKGGTAKTKEPTYYLSIKWPTATKEGASVAGDAQPVFSQTTVFTPNNRENLAAYMSVVADAGSPDYGRLRILRMSDTQQIEGPGQAFNNIQGNEKVANTLLPYLKEGTAKALYGNLLTIPLGGGLLYVQPIYTQREGTDGAFPLLRFVVVRFGTYVGIAETLQDALDQVFSGDAGVQTGEEPGTTTPTTPDTGAAQDAQTVAKAALAEAQTYFTQADTALRNGDLAGYQQANAQAVAAVKRAVDALNR